MKNCKKLFALLLCVAALLTLSVTAFAASGNVSSQISASEVKVGDTLTMTVAIPETTVSSIGVTVVAGNDFEIVSGTWLKSGLMASYDMSKNKGAFSAGGATALSGDIFKLTLKAKSSSAFAKNVSITVIAKNGSAVVFEETATQSVKVNCAAHSFGDYSKTSSEHSRTCTACGYVEKSAHKWDGGKITSAATCTKEGTKTYTCSTCSHTKTEAIKKLDHTYGKWTKVDANNHAKTCSCGDTVTAKHTWDSGKVTTAATCSKEGTKTYSCSGCGATKTEAITKTAHAYSNACDTSCNNCGEIRVTSHNYESKWSSDAKNHWHECSVCKDAKDKATHTSSDWIIDKEATDLKAGSKHKECTICKKVLKTESIPATGCKHGETKVTGMKDATCEEDGYTGDTVCKICNTVMTPGTVLPASGHDIETTNAKEATCTEEGFTGKQVCKACGNVVDEGSVIEKVPHCFADGVCTVCNATDPDASQPTEPSVPSETEPTEPSAPSETEPTKPAETTPTVPVAPTEPVATPADSTDNTGIIIGVIIAAVVVTILVVLLLLKRKKK